jgi:hypothetical protein
MYLLTPCGKNLTISTVLQIFYFQHTGHGGGMHTAAFQLVNPKETDYRDDISIVGRITLIHILRRIRGYGMNSSCLLNGQVMSSCEHRNKSTVSIKCKEFHE